MIETRWWWIRHAPSQGPVNVIHGQDDVDADLSNQSSINSLAAKLPVEAVWLNSGLNRTVQTAEALGGQDVRSVSGLMEQDFGDWCGQKWDALDGIVAKSFWDNYTNTPPPNGESFTQMLDRVTDAVAEITHKYQGKDIIAVAHAGTIRAALAASLNLFAKPALSIQIDTLSLTRIDCLKDDDTNVHWRVLGVNEQAY